ncbi:peptidylprolyl isomerase [Saccharobesus litoralis]|uniref:Peptidyl-prolyl cis-trans isomerase C n=1 Tax=Saccharobesus litoralis TaxID=2172099 RepID=A0A2S0VUM5_9ALTE|nr:peptidylprolyl isomerase [Saccharobesus litoralis]
MRRQLGKDTKAAALHILTRNEKLAHEIKQKADKGEDFGNLARRYSNCPTAKKGGHLGEFSRGVMVKPFEKAVFEAELLKPVGPIKTKFGYHIIKVLYRS